MTTARNHLHQDDLKPVRMDAYLRRVGELLESDEPEILTITIAALTGRRHAEVVSVGSFEETKHPYQLRFEGQQKKAEAEAEAFEIVSLIPARDLLPVFQRFRALPDMQALVGLDDDHPEVTGQQHFADCPVLESATSRPDFCHHSQSAQRRVWHQL